MNQFFAKIISVFSAIALFFSGIAGTSTCSDNVKIVDRQKVSLVGALVAGQGIATDGEYYYTSGSIAALNITGLAKWDLDFNRVDMALGSVPKDFTEQYGSNHIGDIGCYNGYIYAPVEDDDYVRDFVLLYDCDTLEYTGTYYEITSPLLNDGIPWCAVDDEGYFYTSAFDNVNEILRYRAKDMSFVDTIKLSETINRVQGADVYDGKLWVSYDVKDSADEQVLSIDLESGKVETAFERYIEINDNEAEGIIVHPMQDGSLFHVLDYDKLVSVHIRHYAFVK